MKNILFFHSSSDLYGSDRSLLNILKNLDKKKYNIHAFLPSDGPLKDELEKIDNINVKIYDIPILRRKELNIKGGIKYIKNSIKSYKEIKKYIKSNNIELVYTNTSVILLGSIVAKHLKIKSIWHIREIITNKYENKFISYFMNKYSSLVIANSNNTLKSLKLKTNKGMVLYNSIELDEKNINKNKSKKFVIGMAGRINRWKGQKLLVDAAEIVLKQDKNIEFLIAGDAFHGEEYLKNDLINYINDKKLGSHVKLCGQIDNMRDFYKKLDLFILPSIKPEPFGLVILEAMQYGIPVIASNHGGPTEIIKDNINGILFEPNNPLSLASEILKLKNNDRKMEKIRINSIRRSKDFSLENMIKKLEKIIDNILK